MNKWKQKQQREIKQKYSSLTELIDENEKKANEAIQMIYEDIRNSNAKILENLLTVNEKIQTLDCDVKEMFHSMGEKLDQIGEDGIEGQKHLEDVVLVRSETMVSEIDELKSLIQLLAVNELIDKIDVPKVKS